jgi:protein SCO1/2
MALLADSIVCRLLKNKAFFLIGISFFLACNKQKTAEKTTEKETLPFYNTPDFDAEWIPENDARYSKIHQIDTFALSNQQGHLINKDSLDGKIYVANFFFSICPTICPKMMGNLKVLQKTFAQNPQIKLVSFSVMPWVDSVSKLKKYGEDHQINPAQWYLLTGSKEQIYTLARKSYFAEKGLGMQKKTTQFLHTESMLLIDKKARIRGIYNATQVVDIERITDDIHILLKE